jgi:casein kinase I family protein HRR25
MDIVRIDGRYRLRERLGWGSFGESRIMLLHDLTYSCLSGDIYLAYDILGGNDVAVKLEYASGKSQTLEHEYHILKTLGGRVGFPRVHWFGSEGSYNAIVFDCLGPSLEDLFIYSNYKIPSTIISNLARQLVN